VYKATQERVRRKKAAIKVTVPKKVFRGIKPKKIPSKATTHRKRSEASKRGWETRRARVVLPISPIIPSFEPLVPQGLKTRILGGIADRVEAFPKVAKAAYKAWLILQLGKVELEEAIELNQKPPDVITPRFDRLYGKGHGAFVLNNFYYNARELEDLDQMAEELVEMEDNDYSLRELYTLYFSPELA
jgi:hypothetical protein